MYSRHEGNNNVKRRIDMRTGRQVGTQVGRKNETQLLVRFGKQEGKGKWRGGEREGRELIKAKVSTERDGQ